MSFYLQQKKILITRAEPKGDVFAKRIRLYAGQPIMIPLIKIAYTPKNKHKKIFNKLQDYEWIFFTSANGVKHFFKALKEHDALEKIKNCHLAVVGTKTNQALQAFGYEADFIPSIFNAKTMASEFLNKYLPTGLVLLVRGQLSGNILNEAFFEKNIPFDCMEVYETVTNQEMKLHLEHVLIKESIDFMTFTSPSTVDAFMELTSDLGHLLHQKIVCIGTTTEKRAIEQGFQHVLVPNEFTIEGMIEVMHDYLLYERKD